MRALILVDLDNLLADGPLDQLATDAGRHLKSLRKRFSECVTAFALNTTTPDQEDLSWESLEATARALADCLDAPRSRVEIGLTLTMPQAADVLLARLARSSPTDEASGHFHLAVVMTKDGDLRSALADEVFASPKSGWRQVARDSRLVAWTAAGGALPFVRKPPAAPRPRAPEPMSLSGAYTAIVESAAHAAWAAPRRADLQPGLALRDLARRVEEDEPWLLSQVGATGASLRGLSRLPLSGEPLGAIGEKDGVELRGDAGRPPRISTCEAASVGIGAARAPEERATVRSRLPTDVLVTLGSCECDRRGVMVRRAIQHLAVGVGIEKPRVEVQLRGSGLTLIAKVKHGLEHQPRVWWIVGDADPKSEQRIDGAARYLPQIVQTSGVSFRTDGASRVRLGLCCPLDAGVTVRCETAIAQGTIGQAYWDPPHGKPWPIAVYAPRPVGATTALAVVPAHCSDDGPAELRDLPIMVATR